MRQAISKRKRFEIFKRDGFVCQYCGAHPPEVVLHVDHIVAVAGGGNEMDNLVTACLPCNLGKSDVPLASAPQSLKAKAQAVAEAEEQLRGYHEIMEGRRRRIDDESWQIAEALDPGCGESGFNRDRRMSIKRFIERLGYHEVLDAAEYAMSRKPGSLHNRFLYFCGICWTKVRETER